MDLGLKGKTALVGGASKGLGYACARALAQEGANVVLVARTKTAVESAARQIAHETGSQTLAIAADWVNKADLERVVSQTLQQFGSLHVVVNNYGGPKPGGNFDFQEAEWQEAFEQLLLSTYRLVSLVTPVMKSQQWGRIIHIASLTVKEPRPDLVFSNVFRAGIVAFSKTLSTELAAFNITVNTVAPGPFHTERHSIVQAAKAKRENMSVEALERALADSLPVKRVLEPAELASVVAFLSSVQASAITGSVIAVDGGKSSSLL
ncbi:MAG: SDR family oxidoreductase [Candidatus Diapherotrites archaeon]|nr:SDR family oxidoreductase [Candidatus Diapherotrites archaeon]